MFGKAVSDLENSITVLNNNITSASLRYVTDYTGFSSDPALQEGNFIALHWSDPQEGVTSLKVGIVPSSIGMEPVECIDDPDRNGVFRVTDPQNQVIKIIQSDGENTFTQEISLKNVRLDPPANDGQG